MKKFYTLIVFLFITLFFTSAQTNIGGVINIYTPVTNIDNCTCPTTNCANITVSSSAGFSIGDRVLLIQMKGARVDSSNTTAHGSIINLYDAGNYEFTNIGDIAGNIITTVEPLKETYFTNASPKDSACVQLIRVPVYSGDVNITSTLTAQAWNGRTGGVLTFRTDGTVTLNANITVSGLGFQAAARQVSSISCGKDTNFYYQSTIWNHNSCTGCGYAYDDNPVRLAGEASFGGCGTNCFTNRMNTADPKLAGFRGEGVAANTFRKVFSNGNIAPFIKGKGKWGNGGGGGGNHNAGGGGGGNYGAGGMGGNAYNNTSACPAGTLTNRKGQGGTSLTPTGSKIFMGGGGGEGHDNAGQGSTGAPGGGIIFIRASQLTNGSAYSISANGNSVTHLAIADGSGGGGAGGSILLDLSGGLTNAVNISASGGNGGNQNNNNCHGTGGGGGGGVIWMSASSPNAVTNVSGGSNGIQVSASIDCGDINWGATAGDNGLVRVGTDAGYSSFLNINSCSVIILPIDLVSFSANEINNKVYIRWSTSTEINNEYFIVERSADGRNFEEINRMPGAGNSTGVLNYSVRDNNPYNGINYYRLKQVDYDGKTTVFKPVSAYVDKRKKLLIHPNPANEHFMVDLPWHEHFNIKVTDVNGRKVIDQKEKSGDEKIETKDLPKGIYFIYITADEESYFQKLIKINY